MKEKSKLRTVLISLNRYLILFLSMSFVLTCCMMLFLNVLSSQLNLTFTRENIEFAAEFTFGNVIFLSVLFTAIDFIRRKITFDRPVKRITQAAQQMMLGDFSVRIKPIVPLDGDDRFNEIIHCFNKVAQELSANQTLHSDFIANVSHELKTPLSVMQNYATILQQPDLSQAERIQYAKEITSASRRLSSLVTNILKLNKLENQQIFPVKEEFNLSEQLCECLLAFEDTWEKNSIDIQTDIDDEILITADKELLSIIWNNLLSNAFKFTGSGGTVYVSLKKENGKVTVCVADTGCGIPKETGKRIFEKFYQGDTSRATQGNGLGLALVKRIIDITGSSISVESELGKGSKFTVTMRGI